MAKATDVFVDFNPGPAPLSVSGGSVWLKVEGSLGDNTAWLEGDVGFTIVNSGSQVVNLPARVPVIVWLSNGLTLTGDMLGAQGLASSGRVVPGVPDTFGVLLNLRKTTAWPLPADLACCGSPTSRRQAAEPFLLPTSDEALVALNLEQWGSKWEGTYGEVGEFDWPVWSVTFKRR
jgi:hypothetical protein